MKKILVVEDEYYARKSIVKILQESDLDIQVCGEAENGMKAIELLEEYKDIALVIPNWEVTDNFLETGEIDYREIDERVKKYGRGIEYV